MGRGEGERRLLMKRGELIILYGEKENMGNAHHAYLFYLQAIVVLCCLLLTNGCALVNCAWIGPAQENSNSTFESFDPIASGI